MDLLQLPGLSDDENGLLGALLGQLAAKRSRNMLRAEYYDGKRAITQVGTIIPPQYYRLGIVLGWAAKAVDMLADRCNLEGFSWPGGDIDSLGYREIFDGNLLASEGSGAFTSSLLHGTAFLVNTLGDPAASEPAGLIHVKDAMNATGTWNSRARKLDNLLSITGWEQGRIKSLVLYLDGMTIEAFRDGDQWTTVRDVHPWGVPAEPLVYKARPGKPFGQSRISRTVMSLHDQALRTVIRMEGHADVYSFPEMWMLGADESIFKNEDGTQKASFQVMLGRLKGIPDDEDAKNPRADVKQFAASSPEPHIQQFKQQAQSFSGETSIPLTSLGVSDMSNPTSADSLRVSRADLEAAAERAHLNWKPALNRAFRRALAMANGLDTIPDEWASIGADFQGAGYESRASEADAGLKLVQAAPWLAETTVGLSLMGLDKRQIELAMAERRRNAGRAALASLTQAATSARGDVPAEVVQ